MNGCRDVERMHRRKRRCESLGYRLEMGSMPTFEQSPQGSRSCGGCGCSRVNYAFGF